MPPRWWGGPAPIWGRLLAVTVPVPGLQGYVPGALKQDGFVYWPGDSLTGDRMSGHSALHDFRARGDDQSGDCEREKGSDRDVRSAQPPQGVQQNRTVPPRGAGHVVRVLTVRDWIPGRQPVDQSGGHVTVGARCEEIEWLQRI